MRKITKVNQIEVGSNNYHSKLVINIKYHRPAGEGDKHYCVIQFEDGTGEVYFIQDGDTIYFEDVAR